MNELADMLVKMNMDPAKLSALAAEVQSNPFAAMGKMQEYGITPDMLQKILKMVMKNPQGFMEMAQQAGIPEETLASVKQQMDRFS